MPNIGNNSIRETIILLSDLDVIGFPEDRFATTIDSRKRQAV